MVGRRRLLKAAGVTFTATAVGVTATDMITPGTTIRETRIGIVSDTHWRDGSRAEAVPDKADTKANMDAFADEMNNNFQPDFIVQQGDLIDGLDTTFSEQLTWTEEAIDYLENQAGSSGTGVDAPVYHLLGNHEYAFSNSGDMSQIYSKFGWSSIDDTWRRMEQDGMQFVFLNTGYSPTDKDGSNGNHELPQAEIDWMKNKIDRYMPTYVFMHCPISEGPDDSYSDVKREAEAQGILSEINEAVFGFFGHCHYAGGDWDTIRMDSDSYGTNYLHTASLNVLLDDQSYLPFSKVTVQEAGGWEAKTSYEDTGYDLQNRFNNKFMVH